MHRRRTSMRPPMPDARRGHATPGRSGAAAAGAVRSARCSGVSFGTSIHTVAYGVRLAPAQSRRIPWCRGTPARCVNATGPPARGRSRHRYRHRRVAGTSAACRAATGMRSIPARAGAVGRYGNAVFRLGQDLAVRMPLRPGAVACLLKDVRCYPSSPASSHSRYRPSCRWASPEWAIPFRGPSCGGPGLRRHCCVASPRPGRPVGVPRDHRCRRRDVASCRPRPGSSGGTPAARSPPGSRCTPVVDHRN